MQQFHKFITWRFCVAQHVSGAPISHHQELTTALTASGFTLERGGSSAVGRGRDHDQQRCYHQRSNGKTRGC